MGRMLLGLANADSSRKKSVSQACVSPVSGQQGPDFIWSLGALW